MTNLVQSEDRLRLVIQRRAVNKWQGEQRHSSICLYNEGYLEVGRVWRPGW